MRRTAAAFACAVLTAVPAFAEDGLDDLVEALRLEEIVTILVEEGRTYSESLNEDLLGGEAGSYFFDRVEGIYAPDVMVRAMRDALGEQMTPGQISETVAFFSSDLGQSIISLENSARRAFSDPSVEEMAQQAVDAMGAESARFQLIEEYIEVNDLVDRNVQGTLSSDYSFFRGMAAVQGAAADERALLSELFSQRDEMERETRTWLYGFLVLAYQPLSDADLRENIAFSASDAGQALNEALFVGFDRLYDRISYDLGEAVAFAMQASDL